MAKLVRFVLTGRIPDVENKSDLMWQWTRQRTEHDAIFVDQAHIEEMDFPGSQQYTPEGYRD